MKTCLAIIFCLVVVPALGQAEVMMTDTTGRLHSRLRPRAGFAVMSFVVNQPYWNFNGATAYRVGFEAETLLKSSSKWSVPFFLDYEWFTTQTSYGLLRVNLRSVNFGISGRRYFQVDDRISCFFNMGIFYGAILGEAFGDSNRYSHMNSGLGYAIGAGFLMGRVSAEMNYSSRSIAENDTQLKYKYSGAGLILSYTISN